MGKGSMEGATRQGGESMSVMDMLSAPLTLSSAGMPRLHRQSESRQGWGPRS